MDELLFVTSAARDRLERDLGLRRDSGQDWKIEAADAGRVEDLISSYRTISLTAEEDFALLSLIVASAEERLASDKPGPSLAEVCKLIKARPAYWRSLAQTWANNKSPDDRYCITPHLKTIFEQ